MTFKNTICLGCVICMCMLCTNLFSQSSQRSYSERVASHVHRVVNQYRATIRRSTLSRKAELDKIAQGHAEDVAAGRVPFSHEGFKQRVEAVKPYARFPYRVAENLYGVVNPAQKVAPMALKGWIDSPGHHVNLKGKFLFTGIGVAQSPSGEWIVCQLYVGKNE